MLLSYQQALRNERLNAIEVFLATPFIVMVTQFVPVLVTRLGASPLLLGILTSGGALMLTIASALGPAWIRRAPNWPRNMTIPLLIWRTVLVWTPLLLFLPAYKAEAIVATVVLLHFASGISIYTLTAFLSRMTLPERVAHLVSMRWTMLGIGMAVFTVILAAILDALPLPLSYLLACVLALIISIAGVIALGQVRVAPLEHQPAARPHANTRTFLTHLPARNYLLITLLAQIAVNAPSPLITLQMVRVLQATNVDYGWYLAIFWLSLAGAGLVVPQLTERFGNTLVFAIACVGLGMQLVILAIAPVLPVTWAAGFIGGPTSVMFQVTSYALMVQCAPLDKFEGYVGAHTTVTNFALFIGPLLMSALVDSGMSIAAGLLASALLRAASGMLALRLSLASQPA
jgi:MFS family permease